MADAQLGQNPIHEQYKIFVGERFALTDFGDLTQVVD